MTSITSGKHNIKFGFDNNYLPINASFTVNFGGVYNFGGISLGDGTPALTPVRPTESGIPQYFVQGVGNPHDSFSVDSLGLYAQDSWRMTRKLTINYGLRYDIEFRRHFRQRLPSRQRLGARVEHSAGNSHFEEELCPRVGFAWDIGSDGKTVLRSSYVFYDQPLLGLIFDSDVVDGSQAPQLLLFGGIPTSCGRVILLQHSLPLTPSWGNWGACHSRLLICRTSSASIQRPIRLQSG